MSSYPGWSLTELKGLTPKERKFWKMNAEYIQHQQNKAQADAASALSIMAQRRGSRTS